MSGILQGFHKLDVESLKDVPECLKDGERWVAWQEVIRNDEPTKVPMNAKTGHEASVTKLDQWTTLPNAVLFYQKNVDRIHGIGRVFVEEDGLVGVDFDDCLDDQGSIVSPFAVEWLPKFNSYSEVSPSGCGVKLWIRARLPEGGRGRNNRTLHVEAYQRGRFFAVTGQRLPQFSAAVEERQEILDAFYRVAFGDTAPQSPQTPPVQPSVVRFGDEEVLRRASESAGIRLRQLWEGDWQAAGYKSQSEADLALCSILWFWTGDKQRVRRLFSESQLGKRDKWVEREDYRESTLEKACNGDVYRPPASPSGGAVSALRARIIEIHSTNEPTAKKHERIASAVVDFLRDRGTFYFHQQFRDFATAMYFDGESKRLLRVQSDEFLSCLAALTAISRGSPAFRYIVTGVEDAALQGTGIIPEVYWALRDTAVYMSNGDGQVVKITANKVTVVDNGTDGVVFPIGCTLPKWNLTTPKEPFQTCRMFREANYSDPHAKTLVSVWATSLPTNPKCKPPLVFAGEPGSGKTKTAIGIAALYGLPTEAMELENVDKSQHDFWVAANGGGMLVLDNIDDWIKWLPSSLSAAATGGGKSERLLYTNTQKVTLLPRAWLALTTANPLFAADTATADRLLLARMRRRTGETADGALLTEIAVNRDAGLSWVANTIAKAVADDGACPAQLNQRHPDFAAFAVKLGRAMGCEAEVVAALQSAERDKSRFCLENDPAGKVLLELMGAEPEGFTGTAGDLLERLSKYDSDFSSESVGVNGKRLWSPKRLGKRLSGLWGNIGVLFDAQQEKNRDKVTVFHIRLREDCGVCGV